MQEALTQPTPTPQFESWICHAKPVSKGGQSCKFYNAYLRKFNGLVVCRECGCTKVASDLRRSACTARGCHA